MGLGFSMLAAVTVYMICYIEEKKEKARGKADMRERLRKLGLL